MPLLAVRIERFRILRPITTEQIHHLRFSLDKLQREPLLQMPAYVAMRQPCTGVVGAEGDSEMPLGGKHGRVAFGDSPSRSVDAMWWQGIRPLALCDHEEIVAVQMYRVRCVDGGFYDDQHPGVGSRDGDGGVRGWKQRRSFHGTLDLADGRVAPVDGHRGPVELPAVEGIFGARDCGRERFYVEGLVGREVEIVRHERHELRAIFVGAAIACMMRCRARDRVYVLVVHDPADVFGIAILGAGGLGYCAQPEGVCCFGLVGMHDYIVALTCHNVKLESVPDHAWFMVSGGRIDLPIPILRTVVW